MRCLKHLLIATSFLCICTVGLCEDVARDAMENALAIIRINNIDRFDLRIEELLKAINPDARGQDPVRELVGAYVRNPRLIGLQKGAFFELVMLSPGEVKGNPLVVAFPVEDGREYRSLITHQSRLRDEGTADDITSYKEELRDGASTWYLTVTTARIAIFGSGREAVRKARSMYERAVMSGLLPRATADIVCHLNLRPLLRIVDGNTRSEQVETALIQLSNDILIDLAGDNTPADHPLRLGLQQARTDLLDLLRNQLDTLSCAATIGSDRIRFRTLLTPVNSSLRAILMEAVSGTPSLARFLPATCILCFDTMLWPEMWGGILKAGGKIALASMGRMIGLEAREELTSIIDAVAAAKPLEIAEGWVPPPETDPGLGPQQVRIIRWGHPEKLAVVVERINSALQEEGSVAEMLKQRIDMSLIFASTSLEDLPGDIATHKIQFQPVFSESAKRELENFGLGQSQSHLVAWSGPVQVIVSSAASGSSSLSVLQRQTLASIMERIATKKTGFADFMSAVKHTGGKPYVTTGTIAPLRVLQMAMMVAADWRKLGTGDLKPISRQYAEEFAKHRSHHAPVTYVVTVGDEQQVKLDIDIPLVVLQDLAVACLGIRSRAEEE